MFKIKELDLEIIKILYELKNNETVSTYKLAKRIFDFNYAPKKYKHPTLYFKAKDKTINNHVKKISEAGLIKISKINGRYLYTLILNKVCLKSIKDKRYGIDFWIILLKIEKKWELYYGNQTK